MTGVSPSRYNGPMAVELSVVAPCYNEEDNVEELVARVFAMFRAHEIDGELVLVDDGSTDDTWPALRAASQEHDNVVVVSHEKNAGNHRSLDHRARHLHRALYRDHRCGYAIPPGRCAGPV